MKQPEESPAEYSCLEEKHRLVVESAGEAMLIAQDGMLKCVNAAALGLTGYSEELLTSRPFIEFVHPEDREMVVDRHLRRLRGEDLPRVYPFRIAANNGATKWVELFSVKVLWKGKPATLNFLTDITERKKVEEALRASEARYRCIVETANEGIAEMDTHSRMIFVNPRICETLGYTLEEIIGRPVTDFMFEEDLPSLRAKMEERKAGTRGHYEWRVRCKDGRTRWIMVSAAPLLDEAGQFVGSFAMFSDITERKQAEEALRKAEEKYRNLFENAVEGIFQSTPDGRFVLANPSLAKMYGYSSPEELIASVDSIEQLYACPEQRQQLERLIVKQGEVKAFEVQQKKKDGSTFWVAVSARRVYAENGDIYSYEGQIVRHK